MAQLSHGSWIRRLMEPWTTPCTRCTGPRWTAPKGYAPFKSEPFAGDHMVLDACVRRTTARAPETGWRGGASPMDRRRTLIRPTGHQIARGRALHVVGATGHTPRRLGRRSAHPRRPAPKGAARGLPACGRWCCGASPSQRMTGICCSPRGEGPGELTGEEKATVRRLDDGGRSGSAPA
jgi:hypothetical protein